MIPSWGTYKPTMAASVWVAAIRHAPPMIRRRLQSLGWLKPEIRSPIDIVVRNVKFRAHLSGNTPEHKLVFQGRRLDRWHLSYMRPRLADGACFVDVGANFGYFTLVAAQMLRAFDHGEPIWSAALELAMLVDANRYYRKEKTPLQLARRIVRM